GEIDGAFRAWGIPKGGTGSLSNAIAHAAQSLGAEILTSAPVARINVQRGRARGVVLENGDEIEARVVLSSVDSRRTFIDLLEPSMGPPGKHVISCCVQYAPYTLAPGSGSWDDNREAFGDAVIDRIAEFAPNIRDVILHRQVLTPLDIERTTGLSEGNIFQG